MRAQISGIVCAVALLSSQPASAIEFTVVDRGLVSQEFVDTVNNRSTDAAVRFVGFLSQGMLSQSFTLQHSSLQGSAAASPTLGLHLGIELNTFPLGKIVNVVGKTENTDYAPVLPRIVVGYTGGQKLTWGIGYSIVPPITVSGGGALVMGVDATVGYPVTSLVRLGLEADASLGQAKAPVVAPAGIDLSQPEYANVPADRYAEVCEPQAYGCIDTLTLSHAGLLAVAAFKVHRNFQPFVKVGATYLSEAFDVQVDLSRYRLTGLEPRVSLGASLGSSPRLRSGIGFSASYRPGEFSSSGSAGLMYRFELGLSYAL